MAYPFALWVACLVVFSAYGDEPAASVLRQRLVDQARELYGPQEAEFFAGRVTIWGVCVWSVRWLEAERKLAPGDLPAQQAVRAHVERVRRLDRWIKEEAAAGRGWMERYLESEFYRMVAEAMLSGGETGKPKLTMGGAPSLTRLAVAQLIYGAEWTRLRNSQGGPFYWVAYWSLAVREAEMELRKDNQSRRAAARAHLKRMQDMEQVAKQWFEAKQTMSHLFAETTFYRADAEVLVSELMDPSANAQRRRAEAVKLRLDSASSVFQGTWDGFLDRYNYPENIYERSVQWRSAALATAKSKADRIAASEAHLSRMEALNKVMNEKYTYASARHLLACQYFRTEAQVLLQEVKAK